MNPVLLAIMASVCWGVGTVMQKHGMATSFPKLSPRDFFRQIGPILKTLFTNWLWTLGLALMLGGGLIFMTALGRAGITKILPIICLTGVVAALIGVTLLGEKVQRLEWAGIGLIICGVVAVSRVAGGDTSVIPGNAALLAFTGATCVLVAAALALKRVGATAEFTLSVSAGLIFGLANLMAKLMTQRAAAGVGAEFTLWRGDMALALLLDYPLWVVIAANIGASVFFQTAFANGRASVVSPLVTILSNVLPIVAAVTIFGETVRALHGVGIALVIAGTALMALKSNAAQTAVAEPAV